MGTGYTEEASAERLDVRVLGSFEVRSGTRPVSIPGRKARILLAQLVVARGIVLSRDRLIDGIWGETPPRSAVNTLHTYVTHLRKALGEADPRPDRTIISTHPNGYRIELDDDEVDAWRLDRAVTQARILIDRRDFPTAVDLLDRAVEEWRGSPLEEFDADFARAEAARLDELHYQAHELRVDCLLETGEEPRAIGILESITSAFPYREPLWQHLMLALYRVGRQRDALTAYRRLESTLGEIGLEPGRAATELETRILERDPSLLPPKADVSPAPTARTIPQPVDSFVGRSRELDELSELAAGHRMLTLTGIGGIGKSRLAIELGHRLVADRGSEGRYLDLAPLTESQGIAGRIAETFAGAVPAGAEPLRWIVDHVGSTPFLLVVDNAESVPGGIGRAVSHLVEKCPHLQVIVTAREPLGIEQERIYPVLPLDTATAGRRSEATTLFLQRTRRTDSHPEADLPAIDAVARALGGIPAAIEVAAAATSILGVAEILDNLEAVLEGGNGRQGLPAVFEWTYRTLDRSSRRLLHAASLFVDGCTFDALTETAYPTPDPRMALSDLQVVVDRSLLVAEPGTPSRYRMLDVFRYQTHDRVEETTDDDPLPRFISYFVSMASDLEDSFGTDRWRRALERVDADEANCRRAIDLAVERGDWRSALEIAGPLARYWRWRGRLEEGAERLLGLLDGQGGSEPARAKAEREVAATLRMMGRFGPARDHAERAVEMYEALGSTAGHADALYDMALSMIFSGEFDDAEDLLERASTVWKDLDQPGLAAFPAIPLAWIAAVRGRYDDAEALWTTILSDVDVARFPEHSGITFRLAELALMQGQVERARRVAEDALRSALDAGYPYHEAGARLVLALVRLEEDDLDGAADEARRALSAAEGSGNAEGAAQATVALTRIAALRGDSREARQGMRSITRTVRDVGGALARVVAAELGATVLAAEGRMTDAVMLHGAADAERAAGRLPAGAPDAKRLERELDLARSTLGEAAFRSAFDEGETWTAEDLAGRMRDLFDRT